MPARTLPFLIVGYDFATTSVTDLYLPSLPAITEQLGATAQAGQFSLTLFMLGFAVAHLVFGPLSDACGRKPVMVCGGFAFIASVIVAAMAPDIAVLNVARLLQGVALASYAVTSAAMVRELYDDVEVVKVLSLIAMVEGLAPALAPVIGAEIALAAGWRATFWVVAITASIALLLLIRQAPESLPPERRVPMRLGTMAVTYARLLRRRDFMAPLVAAGLIFAGLMLYLTGAPFFVAVTLDMGERTYALAQFVNVLFYVAGVIVTSRLSGKVAPNRLVASGFVAASVGGVGMIVAAVAWPDSLYSVVGPFCVYALGIGLSMAPLITRALSANPDATGAVAAMMGLITIGCAFLGSLAGAISYDGTALSIAVPLAGLAVLSVGVFALAGQAGGVSPAPASRAAAE